MNVTGLKDFPYYVFFRLCLTLSMARIFAVGLFTVWKFRRVEILSYGTLALRNFRRTEVSLYCFDCVVS